MSTEKKYEFKVGQKVKDDDYDRLPVGAVTSGIEKTGEHEWRKVDGPPMFQWPHATRVITHLPEATQPEAYCVKDVQDGDWWVSESTPEFGYGIVYSHDGTHPTRDHHLDDIVANFGIDDVTQPEDETDAYVEPEPLKEGDACLVWARFGRVDKLDVAHVEMLMPDGRVHDGYTRPDAIVRPDAGQVPPWVKPARCTSLVERTADSLPVLMRCEGERAEPEESAR